MKRVQITEYVGLYTFLLWLFFDALLKAAPRLMKMASMNASELEELFQPVFLNSTLNSTQLLNEVSLDVYPWLRWASVFAVMPVLLTWVVCVWDSFRHVRVMWRKQDTTYNSKKWHDRAIQIIALPAAFGLMSFSAVTRVWDMMCNSFSDDIARLSRWEDRERVASKFYEAHYQIADLYEAWALFHFGKLALEVVDRKFWEMATVAEQEDAASAGRGSLAKLAAGIHVSVQKLTMQGIWSFVIVCFVQSLYGVGSPLLLLFLQQLDFDKDERVAFALRAMDKGEDTIHHIFIGMGLVASTAAIGNIVQVERALHHELQEFRPFWKFWGTKVLVSFAFMQQILVQLPIPPFSKMSDKHKSLFYSTVLCYECFFVSLLHIYAWSPHEAWYDEASPLHLELADLAREMPIGNSYAGL